jgi:hypothetical protein
LFLGLAFQTLQTVKVYNLLNPEHVLKMTLACYMELYVRIERLTSGLACTKRIDLQKQNPRQRAGRPAQAPVLPVGMHVRGAPPPIIRKGAYPCNLIFRPAPAGQSKPDSPGKAAI